jgi:hypothetical protein
VWLFTQHITADAITIGLIFMAVGMLVLRTAILGLRARTVSQRVPARACSADQNQVARAREELECL